MQQLDRKYVDFAADVKGEIEQRFYTLAHE